MVGDDDIQIEKTLTDIFCHIYSSLEYFITQGTEISAHEATEIYVGYLMKSVESRLIARKYIYINKTKFYHCNYVSLRRSVRE
jgi:hypothetical protein